MLIFAVITVRNRLYSSVYLIKEIQVSNFMEVKDLPVIRSRIKLTFSWKLIGV